MQGTQSGQKAGLSPGPRRLKTRMVALNLTEWHLQLLSNFQWTQNSQVLSKMLWKQILWTRNCGCFRKYSTIFSYFPTHANSLTQRAFMDITLFKKCAWQETILNRALCCGDAAAQQNNLFLFCLSLNVQILFLLWLWVLEREQRHRALHIPQKNNATVCWRSVAGAIRTLCHFFFPAKKHNDSASASPQS